MPRSKSSTSRQPRQPNEPLPSSEPAAAAELSYNEAQTALQLTLAALQASDVDVEAMTTLYRQARGYLERCEALLGSVEEELLLWDPERESPAPLSADSD